MIIEEGKRYIRRDGTVSSAIAKSGHLIYPWRDETRTYTREGKVFQWADTKLDLISEYKEPEMKEIDFEKPFRFLASGLTGHFIGPRAGNGYFAVECAAGSSISTVDTFGNTYLTGEPLIENIPEKITRWVNFYNSGYPEGGYHTKDAADKECKADRIACVEVTFEPGEGL